MEDSRTRVTVRHRLLPKLVSGEMRAILNRLKEGV